MSDISPRRWRTAVVVFMDVEAKYQRDAEHKAVATIGLNLHPQAETPFNLTAQIRDDLTVNARVISIETLGSAMYQQFLRLQVSDLPWRFLDNEEQS